MDSNKKIKLIKSYGHEELIQEPPYNDSEDFGEQVNFYLIDKDELSEFKVKIIDYDFHGDGGDEDLYEGEYDIYNLSKYDITINEKKIKKYYKIFVSYSNSRTNTNYSHSYHHVFRYNDNSYDLITNTNPIHDVSSWTANKYKYPQYFKITYFNMEELIQLDKKYDIIGFTKDNAICYLPCEKNDSDKTGIIKIFEKYNIVILNQYSFEKSNYILYID